MLSYRRRLEITSWFCSSQSTYKHTNTTPSFPPYRSAADMPELPEVAALASAIKKEVIGRRLVHVLTKEQGGGPRHGLYDDLVFGKADEQEVHRSMEGRVLTAVGRRGKHLWMELCDSFPSCSQGRNHRGNAIPSKASKTRDDDTRFVLFHMGMTGSLVFQHVAIPQYRSFALDVTEGWPPKHCKAEFVFEESSKEGDRKNELRLAFCDQRRWGRVQILPAGVLDPRTESPLKELAPDAWMERPDLAVFAERLKGTEIPVKAALLDQNRIVCGVGNWVADEVLFQAGVDPAKKCSVLKEEEVRRVWEMLAHVCETACAVYGRSEAFPSDWLFHFRWAKSKKDKAGVRGPHGRRVVFETVGGRTTAIVPSVQRIKGGRIKDEVEGEVVEEQEKVGKGTGAQSGSTRAKKVIKIEGENNDTETSEKERGKRTKPIHYGAADREETKTRKKIPGSSPSRAKVRQGTKQRSAGKEAENASCTAHAEPRRSPRARPAGKR